MIDRKIRMTKILFLGLDDPRTNVFVHCISSKVNKTFNIVYKLSCWTVNWFATVTLVAFSELLLREKKKTRCFDFCEVNVNSTSLNSVADLTCNGYCDKE
jgi:hypothetical protein